MNEAELIKKELEKKEEIEKKINEQIKELPNKRDKNKEINGETINTVTQELKTNITIANTDFIKNMYKKLLTGKTNNEKEEEETIKNREKLLRDRLSAKVLLIDGKGQVATLKFIGILPEELGLLYQYYSNRMIASNQWQETTAYASEIVTEYSGKKVIGLIIDKPSEYFLVERIVISITMQ